MKSKGQNIVRGAGVLLLAAAPWLGGCNIVAPAYYLVHGPEKTKAVHTLDAKKTTVVFIDDRQNRIPRRALRIAIGEEAEKQLLKERAVQDVVSTQSAMAAAGRDTNSGPAPIVDVGRNIKADVVIYATVDGFALSQDGATFRPEAVARVKVIDVASEKRVWPADDVGYVVSTVMAARPGYTPTSTGEIYKAEEELARALGTDIARLFFTHEAQRDPRVPQ